MSSSAAKNVLLGKSCLDCKWHEEGFCTIDGVRSELRKSLPRNMYCDRFNTGFKVRWSLESEKALRSLMNVDVSEELINLANKEMKVEIDREVLEHIKKWKPYSEGEE